MKQIPSSDVPEVLKQRIYEAVRAVPKGMVATYGDIALIVGGGCDARTVGYALQAIPKHGTEEIPWQRVINAQGGISTSGLLQRKLLEDEGVSFREDGRVHLALVRWAGPTAEWAADHGMNELPRRDKTSGEQLALW